MSEKKKILIADDDFDMLEQLKMQLQAKGFEVIACESQVEAESQLEQFKPHLAIYDLMMDDVDSGFVLSYKTKKKYPDVPVIIITAVTHETGLKFDVSTEETKNWIKADVILNKDIRFEQLFKEINRLLGED
ncbi:response regulator [Caldithrix abyssi]|uniref:Response regulator receiver domain-containing protein n=1 Tax=Caldithrix abyssi DSM 13497 TaxID=880073 RepID=H1XPS0_CALAY|nr:response regulator [Caldithrix abyssi]APF20426.1 Response regulator receiver domain-containing protein [Caldithrix abyssi DSM 13497]EHO41046.1 response regulator receiver protein [Caldithrix abyssi DSM 13497]